MGMYNGRTVDDNFLNSYFSYSDEEYLRRLRMFHDTVESLYGLTGKSTMDEVCHAKELRRIFRNELQDETTRRLYRFMESVLALGVPGVFPALSESFDQWVIDGKDDLDRMFKSRCASPWRDMDIWVQEGCESNQPDFWPKDPAIAVTIELMDDETAISLPFKWLTEAVVHNPLSDSSIAEAVALAEVKNDYASLFAHIHTKDGMKAVLDLIRDNGLVEKIEAINEMEHTKYGENKNA